MRNISLLAASALLGCATADQVHALEQRVDLLELELERQAAHPSIIINSDGSTTAAVQAPAGTGGDEEVAATLLKEIQAKIASGKTLEAKKLFFDELRAKHGGTQVYKSRSVSTLEKELSVIGNKVSGADISSNITKWFTTEGDLALESGVTLLVFFEEWCPHCKREVPKLMETYDTYRDKGLKVIGLTRVTKKSTDASVADLISANDVNYPIAKEDGKVAPKFNVSGIPAAAIVKDGVIVWRGNPARLNAALWKNWL